MSTTVSETIAPAGDATQASSNSAAGDSALEYRALHSRALIGALLGVVSVMLLFATDNLASCLALAPIPLAGIFVSLRAWLTIRSERDLYTGAPLAIAGLVLSIVFLCSGVGWAAYIYATEVPDGYERISFLGLKPTQSDERASKPIPDEIVALMGKKIFIKGYIRPDSTTSRKGIDRFLLVRDDNTCCFGDLNKVKYFDQMAVKIMPPKKTDYRASLFRIGGTLILVPQNLNRGAEYPVYALEADYIE